MHDAVHLGVDRLLLLIGNLPALKLVHIDELVAVENCIVVDGVIAGLVEVVLVRVVVLDVDLAASGTPGRQLTKEGASVRNDFPILDAGAEDEELSVGVAALHVCLDELLDSQI